jgi:hypothetical protein
MLIVFKVGDKIGRDPLAFFEFFFRRMLTDITNEKVLHLLKECGFFLATDRVVNFISKSFDKSIQHTQFTVQ